MKKENLFEGTGVALITPFNKSHAVDFHTLVKLVNFVVENGVDYIVALGTTSEAATMSEGERGAIQDIIVETVAGRVPIVLGLGGNNTQAVLDAIQQTNFDGISGILSVTPYYNKPQQRGLLQHFSAIGNSSPVPVIAYNVPGRTGCNMLAETTLQLAETCPNIVAVKEASGNMAQAMEILRCKPDPFRVISGDDALTLPMMAMGASGVISVVANALPKEMSDMVHFALKGNLKKALPLHYDMLPIMHAIFEEGNPGGVKALLEIEGKIDNALRLPLVKVSKQLSNRISTLYSQLKYNA
ncbi:MAG: 4-hydroxy-tetrahydrodipicolinate synthase [Bacteroidales bacterium]|nr:4-hydroxy-tetrahydrodipicolinate synthase [Bacteroidales bacterium]